MVSVIACMQKCSNYILELFHLFVSFGLVCAYVSYVIR